MDRPLDLDRAITFLASAVKRYIRQSFDSQALLKENLLSGAYDDERVEMKARWNNRR